MLDYYSVSGCYILKPWSYSIWEIIQGMVQLAMTHLTMFDINLCTRLVQQGDPRVGRTEFVLPHVRLLQGA